MTPVAAVILWQLKRMKGLKVGKRNILFMLGENSEIPENDDNSISH